jgi:hypothetical protein
MRKSICCLLFACAAAFAQKAPETPAPETQDDKTAQVKAMVEAFKQRLDRLNLVNPRTTPAPLRLQGAPAFKTTVCAIPLLNVIPPGTRDRIPTAQPPAHPRETGDTVKVPAPACDDAAFRNLPQPQVAPRVP